MLKTIMSFLILFSSGAFAQTFRSPQDVANKKFESRFEAIQTLLPNYNTAGVTNFSSSTNCELGVIGGDLTVPFFSFSGPIGVNLSKHCDGAGNVAAGVSFGGGFSSLQPFRLISLPKAGQTRVNSVAKNTAAGSRSTSELHFLGWNETEWNISASLFGSAIEVAANPYSTASDGETLGLQISAASTSRLDTTYWFSLIDQSNETASFLDEPIPGSIWNTTWGFSTTAPNYSAICGTRGGGSADQQEFMVGKAGKLNPLNGWEIDYSIGAAIQTKKYSMETCSITAIEGQGIITEVFRGRLNGKTQSIAINSELQATRYFETDFGRIGPFIGGNLSHTVTRAYDEYETALKNGVADLSGSPGYNFASHQLGTALSFDTQSSTRLIPRVGIGFMGPVTIGEMDGWWNISGAVKGDFIGEPNRITASFVEDGRTDPFKFSFNSVYSDPLWGEISAGINLSNSQQDQLSLIFTTVVGHKYLESTSMSLQFSRRF